MIAPDAARQFLPEPVDHHHVARYVPSRRISSRSPCSRIVTGAAAAMATATRLQHSRDADHHPKPQDLAIAGSCRPKTGRPDERGCNAEEQRQPATQKHRATEPAPRLDGRSLGAHGTISVEGAMQPQQPFGTTCISAWSGTGSKTRRSLAESSGRTAEVHMPRA